MPSITSAGVGSGLNVESIVSQLMDVERIPLRRLQQKQTQVEAQISAYGQLKSSLSKFQSAMQDVGSASALKLFKTTSSNESVLTATASSAAKLGVYNVEVVRLAENHKMASVEKLDTDTFGGAAGDSLSIQVGSDPANTLTIDMSTAKTLGDIRDAINNAATNPGVSATVIHGNNGMGKLVLTAKDSGSANALTLSYGGAITSATLGFSTVNNIAGNTALLDAEINLDGYNITRSSNNINDVISGVTLNLAAASPGTTVTVGIERDIDKVETAVKGFVDAFNELRASIKTLRQGQLEADSSLLQIERQIFSVLNTPASGGTYSVLSEVGLTMQKDGTMALNSADLKTALQGDFNAVSDLFAADGRGFANRLDTLADTWLTTGGLIESRTNGLDSRKKTLLKQQDAMQRRLVTTEERLRARFAALDSLVGQLQSTGNFLSRQLSQLPGGNQG